MWVMAGPKSSLFLLRLIASTALSSELSLDVFSRICVASIESTYLHTYLLARSYGPVTAALRPKQLQPGQRGLAPYQDMPTTQRVALCGSVPAHLAPLGHVPSSVCSHGAHLLSFEDVHAEPLILASPEQVVPVPNGTHTPHGPQQVLPVRLRAPLTGLYSTNDTHSQKSRNSDCVTITTGGMEHWRGSITCKHPLHASTIQKRPPIVPNRTGWLQVVMIT